MAKQFWDFEFNATFGLDAAPTITQQFGVCQPWVQPFRSLAMHMKLRNTLGKHIQVETSVLILDIILCTNRQPGTWNSAIREEPSGPQPEEHFVWGSLLGISVFVRGKG